MNDDHMAYQARPFPPDRQLIIEGGRFASRKHTVFALIEVDVTTIRRRLREHKARG